MSQIKKNYSLKKLFLLMLFLSQAVSKFFLQKFVLSLQFCQVVSLSLEFQFLYYYYYFFAGEGGMCLPLLSSSVPKVDWNAESANAKF